MLIDQKSPYMRSVDFYNTKCSFTDVSSEQWHDEMLGGIWEEGYSVAEEGIFEETPAEIISYIRTYPLVKNGKNLGNITVLIDKNQLFSMYNSLFPNEDGELYVFDGKENLLMASGKEFVDFVLTTDEKNEASAYEEEKINGSRFYKFNFEGEKNGWHYMVLMRHETVLKRASSINILLNILNILSFLIGCAICIYFSYGRNKSYINILNMLGIENQERRIFFGPKNNEIAFWQPYIKDLLDEKKAIKEDYEKISNMENNLILQMLFRGEFNNETEARGRIKRAKMTFGGDKFLVLTLSSETPRTSETDLIDLKIIWGYVIESFIDNKAYIYHASINHTAVLFSFDEENEHFYQKIKQLCNEIHLKVFYEYNLSILMGISDVVIELCGIERAFYQSKEVIEYNYLVGNNDIIFHHDLPQEDIAYYYPIEMESKIISCVGNGDFEGAKSILDALYVENFKKRILTRNNIDNLMKEIYATLNKINSTHLNEEQMAYNIEKFSVSKFFQFTMDFVRIVCAEVNAVKDNWKSAEIAKVFEYINDNYMQCDLSLTSLAEHSKLNDITYISKVFKTYAGENFSVYLEKLRIEKACELLCDGRYTIKEISNMVGYLSDVTFRRAFKKRKGVSPTEYTKISL